MMKLRAQTQKSSPKTAEPTGTTDDDKMNHRSDKDKTRVHTDSQDIVEDQNQPITHTKL